MWRRARCRRVVRAGDFDTLDRLERRDLGRAPGLSYFLDSWHSSSSPSPAQPQPPRNWQRWSHPELDKIIEQIRTVGFDDPKGVELGHDYVKLTVREMPIIPLMSYNVFTAMDTTYWTGFPTADEPYTPIRCRTGAIRATCSSG